LGLRVLAINVLGPEHRDRGRYVVAGTPRGRRVRVAAFVTASSARA
jgi:hypothetical protein